MTDLLTHVLVVYIVATVAVRRLDWFRRRYVGIAMVGTVIPDASKGLLLTGPEFVLFDTTLSWYALQTVGGATVFAIAGVLLFDAEERLFVLVTLSFGIVVHLILDLLVIRTDGTAPSYFYPLTWWRPPSGNVYLSSDIWPSLVAIVGSVIVLYLDQKY
jgi:hypothetical protein